MIKNIAKRLLELGIEVDESSSAMLAYWDENLICRYANHAYTDWFGVHPENMVNKMSIKELLGPLYVKNKPFIDGALKGEVQIFNRNIISPFGETRQAIATYCPVIDGDDLTGFYVHVEDATIRNNQRIAVITEPTTDVMANVKTALEACLLTEFPGIDNLAKQHLLSASKLKKDFKARYNKSIFSFYRHLQMELAESYITERKFTKKQVASLLNFTNSTNFIICYQKHLKEKADQKVIEEITRSNDDRYKTFITQAPFAIAMFDNNMEFKAASQKFIDDYKLSDKKINGASYYELFPLLDKKWKKINYSALNGATLNGEDQVFDLANGYSSWVRWDIRPWRNMEGNIGGILIYTEDITLAKIKEEENAKILEILNRASEFIKIGTWEKNFKNNTGFWSDITKTILEVPVDYQLTSELLMEFYKKGKSRNVMQKLAREAIDHGKPFDINSTIITAKGNEKKVRVVGYPEFRHGKCERLFGIFQEIDSYTRSSMK